MMMSTFKKSQNLKFEGILTKLKIKGFYTTHCRRHMASLGHNGLNHIIKMVIYPTQERDDDVVDPEHRDDDFEDVGHEMD